MTTSYTPEEAKSKFCPQFRGLCMVSKCMAWQWVDEGAEYVTEAERDPKTGVMVTQKINEKKYTHGACAMLNPPLVIPADQRIDDLISSLADKGIYIE